MKKRAVGVVYKDDKILLIHRIKDGKEYFVFPGGTVEDNEEPLDTMIRELDEEATIKVTDSIFIFHIQNISQVWGMRDEYWFLVKDFTGEPILGGPEKERMNDTDQYHLIWKSLEEIKNLDNLMPPKGKNKVLEYLN